MNTLRSWVGGIGQLLTAFLVLVGALAAGVSGAQGQTSVPFGQVPPNAPYGGKVVHILQEPRHRTVFVYNDDVRVLDVQINANDTTVTHTHDSPILYNFISSGTGSSDGRLQSTTSYIEEPISHYVSNGGPGLFRIIALPNFSDGVADLAADMPDGLTAEPNLVNPWYRAWRIELAPGQESPMLRHRNPVLIVQVTDGKTQVTREDGITAELTEMGSWTWRNPETSYRIRNTGTTPLAVNVSEARGLR